jgi:hypothetical protein
MRLFTPKYAMRWTQIIEAKQIMVSGHRLYLNPMLSHITNLIKQSGSMRGLTDGKTVWLWEANSAIHPETAQRLAAMGAWEGIISRHGNPEYAGWQVFLIRDPASPFAAMEREWDDEMRTLDLKNGLVLLVHTHADVQKLTALKAVARWLA